MVHCPCLLHARINVRPRKPKQIGPIRSPHPPPTKAKEFAMKPQEKKVDQCPNRNAPLGTRMVQGGTFLGGRALPSIKGFRFQVIDRTIAIPTPHHIPCGQEGFAPTIHPRASLPQRSPPRRCPSQNKDRSSPRIPRFIAPLYWNALTTRNGILPAQTIFTKCSICPNDV